MTKFGYVGVLIVATMIAVGCSTDNADTSITDGAPATTDMSSNPTTVDNNSSAKEWRPPSPPSTTTVRYGETISEAVPPYGKDNVGGGDLQFDAIINHVLTDKNNDNLYERELRPKYQALAHQMCTLFENGAGQRAAAELAQENGLTMTQLSAIQTGALFAYCPDLLDEIYGTGRW